MLGAWPDANSLPADLPSLVRELSQYDNRASDLTKEGMLKGIEQEAGIMCDLCLTYT